MRTTYPLDAALIHPDLPNKNDLEVLLQGAPGGSVLELGERVAHQLCPPHLQAGPEGAYTLSTIHLKLTIAGHAGVGWSALKCCRCTGSEGSHGERGAHPQDQVGEVPPGEKVADDPLVQLQVLLPQVLQVQQLRLHGGAVQEGVPAN